MKLLHLSDLHLGKRLNGCSLLEDQRDMLEQVLCLSEEADAVLLAGDIYDRADPSAEAVSLFDRFLTRLSDRGKPVCIISGNHDSPQRLSFGASLMGESGVHIAPVYDGTVEPVILRDVWGEVAVWLLPFLKPAALRPVCPEGSISTCQEAVAWALERMDLDPACRNVLVAHQYVAGTALCQSEELNIGGLDQVDAALFDGFDYVALGHIHTPQQVGRETVRYCGSPLKYSASEAGQTKGALLVTLEEKGKVTVEQRPIRPLHDLVCLEGSYLELTDRRFWQDRDREDYTYITLTDEEDVPQAMGKLRAVYPNLLGLRYDNQRTRTRQSVSASAPEEQRPLELLERFYQAQNNRPLSDEQRAYAKGLLDELWEGEP
ncbi:MAG: exonuclease SbcCD subunit D [Clostridiales bacterium]|nr:exonuclease SbcCD subunit D [Clostridiales bacterium]